MFGRVEMVTPKIAEVFLLKSRGNRSFRKSRMVRYCYARTNGQWELTHQGLAFDEDDVFIDGHHRCKMVIDTGLPTQFFVIRNVPRNAAKYIDQGLPRSMRDALAMAGIGNYSNDLLTVAKHFQSAPDFSHGALEAVDDILDVIERHAEAIDFGCGSFKSHSVGISRAIRCLMSRAWYYCDRDRLTEFAQVIVTGQVKDPVQDCAAIVYRNALIRGPGKFGNAIETDRYKKGQTALASFIRREPMTKVCGSEKDLYPIPEEI